jgi:hypothetical protein
MCCCVEGVFAAGQDVQPGMVADEMHITETKGRCLLAVCEGVFPGTQEEKETDDYHVSDGVLFRVGRPITVVDNMLDDLEWNWFNPFWRWVLLCVGL